MKPQLLMALCAMLIAVASVQAQTTQTEIRADLLQTQILAELKAKNYAKADALFREYDALGVDMPPPLQLQRALTHFHLKKYVEAEDQLLAYLQRAQRGSDEYRQALSMLAEVKSLAEKAAVERAEAARKAAAERAAAEAKAARKAAEAKRKAVGELAARTPVCKGKGGEYESDSLHEVAAANACLTAAWLIKNGADANAHTKTIIGATPLHWAAGGGCR